MNELEKIGEILMQGLRQMDAEAVTKINEHPAGLYGYTAHRRSESRKYEDVWSERLSEILRAANYDAQNQIAYPNQNRKKCDLHVVTPSGYKVWIEFKTAWKSWFNRWDGVHVTKNSFYLPYLFGPFQKGLKKSHSMVQDFEKLEQYTGSHESAAFLLVGFDSVDLPMLADVDRVQSLLNLKNKGWFGIGPDIWPDKCCSSCRICSWYWWRQGSFSPPAQSVEN